MTGKKTYLLLITLILFLPLFHLQAEEFNLSSSEGASLVETIEVKGNLKVDEATIRFYIHTKIGEKYSIQSINDDIHRLYELGHFEDIRVEKEELEKGIKLIYSVVEKSTLREIKIIGNDKISEEDIKEKITLKKGAVFNNYIVKEDIEKIKLLYQEKGFYFAQISLETKKVEENQIDLELKINEGGKIKIKKIHFKGNKYFSERELRNQMKTTTKGLFSWLTDSGVYKKEDLKMDILNLESFYHDAGFAKIKIYDPEIEINKKDMAIYITIPLTEGEQYRVKDVKIKGDDTYRSDELISQMKLKSGNIYNKSLLREDIFKLSELYTEKGYAYPDLVPIPNIDDTDKTVDLELEINRGRKYYIGQIDIKGNNRTRDRIIRREFRLKEGEVFNSKKLRRTMQRINNLGFFEEVKLDLDRGNKDDLLNINTTLTEKLTGSFNISAGYSSFDQFIYSAQVSENNFLGYGQKLTFTLQRSSKRQDYQIDFTEPRLFDREISAGFNLINQSLAYDNYESLTQGGGFQFGKGIGEYNWVNLGYRYEHINISGVTIPTSFLQNEKRITSRITSSAIRDTRDDYWSTTSGMREELTAAVAGNILGGTDFYKFGGEVSYFHPLGWDFVGVLHGRINYASGYGKDRLPIFERYHLGYGGDLRGFNPDNIGPRDEQGETLGGDKLLLFNAEITYPFSKGVHGLIFYDRGNVFGDGPDLTFSAKNYSLSKMRDSVGFGIRFFTPIPINFSVGFKLNKHGEERLEDYNFNIGGFYF